MPSSARRAGCQIVRFLSVVVNSLTRSVSAYRARVDVVRVLAPRTCEGGAASPQTGGRGSPYSRLPSQKCHSEPVTDVTGVGISIVIVTAYF